MKETKQIKISCLLADIKDKENIIEKHKKSILYKQDKIGKLSLDIMKLNNKVKEIID